MTAYSPKVAKFATAGNRTNTYDDKDSRVVMRNHFAKQFPKLDIVFAPPKAKYDLIAYKKNSSEIVCFFELDHSIKNDWQYPTWGYYSVLERKEKSMTKWNKIAPMVMVWINQSMTKYIALNLRDVNIFDYPLQPIPYKEKEDRKNLKHPWDFHRRISFDNPVYEIGE
jgi:hypothetical protein